MSAFNLKRNEKDFNEITLRAWCVSLVTERFNGLVLEAGQTKLKRLVSMEWTQFLWKESILVFLELMCCSVAGCLPRKQTLEQRLGSLWKMFLLSTIGINTCGSKGWAISWAARLNGSSEFTWDSTRGQVLYIPVLVRLWTLAAHGRKCDHW